MNHFFSKAGRATAASIFLLASVIQPAIAMETSFPTSFDCAKAATKIENAICHMKELADADVQMTTLHRHLLSTLPADQQETLKRNQKRRLKERDAACDHVTDINSCLKDRYVQQIAALKNRPQSAAKPSSKKESLLQRLLSSNKSNREFAAGDLGRLDVAAREALVKELIKALTADNYEIRRRVADALMSDMKPVSPDAEPALVAALSDSNSEVCAYAESALIKIGTESAKSAITEYEQNKQICSKEQATAKEKQLHRLYKKSEIVSSIPPDSNNKYPLDLEYAFSIATYNQNELYVTLHKGKDRDELLRFWRKTDDRYAIIKEMTAEKGMAYFEHVTDFDYNVARDRQEQFIHVPLIYSGTGHYRKDTIYCIMQDLSLQGIVIEPAPDWLADKLKPREGVWKGETLSIAKDKLEFEFHIWNEGDANCCPTAGRVQGTYKIIKDAHYDENKKSEVANFRMIVDTYKRLPAENNNH